MALGTYSELQAAIANWLARPGDATLTPFIPDFIRLAEARISRDLRLRAMELRATAEITDGHLALPAGFLEMRNLQLNTQPAVRLDLVSPEAVDALRGRSPPGRPPSYAGLGGESELAAGPEGQSQAAIAHT